MQRDLLTVTEIAKEYVAKAGHAFHKLEKAQPDETQQSWRLTFAVGVYGQEKKTVIIDDRTGKVIAFE